MGNSGRSMHICSRIREDGKQVWKNGFNDTEREKDRVCTNVQGMKVLQMERWGKE